ncbi:MAG TPA: hypothetical protein VFO91_05835 [Anaerolineales bacterium]|nr:hypothetical protein [Anaerolineales bacterium]
MSNNCKFAEKVSEPLARLIVTTFHRFAYHFQDARAEFREFVQK